MSQVSVLALIRRSGSARFLLGLALVGCFVGPLPSQGTKQTGDDGPAPEGAAGNRPPLAPVATPSPAGTAATEPGVALRGIWGQVVDDGGKPVPGARVALFEVGGTPEEVSTASAAPASYRVAAVSQVVTDGAGRYSLAPDSAGEFNVEAAGSEKENMKFFKAGISYAPGQNVPLGSNQLKPTGEIKGQVVSADGGASDFSHTAVYIPGTSNVGMTEKNGKFRISGVAVNGGGYDLAAYHPDMGEARIPAPDDPRRVKVESGRVTDWPLLRLKLQVPVLAALRIAGSGELTDNAGPGATLDIAGSNFGWNRRALFRVEFPPGGSAARPVRLNDNLLQVTVPAGAANGSVFVWVSNVQSNEVRFRAIRELRLACGPGIVLRRGQSLPLESRLEARDSEGNRIFELPGQAVPRPRPNVRWESSNPDRGSLDPRGVLTAMNEGTLSVSVVAGSLRQSCDVLVSDTAPIPTPTPVPTPLPAPTPPATPTPLATPTPPATPTSPAPTPTPTASPAKAYALQVTIFPASPGAIFVPGTGAGNDVLPTWIQLSAEVSLSNATLQSRVNWSSSARGVADVDDAGRVTARAPGRTVITATSLDGLASAAVSITVEAGGQAEVEVD